MKMNRRVIIKDKSTIKRTDYLKDHFYFTILQGIITYMLMPIILPVTQSVQSIIGLVFCMLITSLLGIVVTYHNNRTGISIFWNVVSGVGCYVILVLGSLFAGYREALLIIISSVTLVDLIPIWFGKKEYDYFIKNVFQYRMLKSLAIIRRNVLVTAVVGMFMTPFVLYFIESEKLADTYSVKQSTEDSVDCNVRELEVEEVYGDEYRLSNNIDSIKRIRDNDTFQDLSYDEKCQVIEDVILCEARYLGLCKINIVFDETLNDITMGRYNHSTRTIHINNNIVENGNMPGGSAEEILRTCIHECRHCYQHLVIEMYREITPEQRNLLAFELDGVKEWAMNSEQYHSGQEGTDKSEYFNQPLERDARGYAAKEVLVYYAEIDRLLVEQREAVFG